MDFRWKMYLYSQSLRSIKTKRPESLLKRKVQSVDLLRNKPCPSQRTSQGIKPNIFIFNIDLHYKVQIIFYALEGKMNYFCLYITW